MSNRKNLAAAAALVLTASACAAQEPRTGVSHPDETDITTSAPSSRPAPTFVPLADNPFPDQPKQSKPSAAQPMAEAQPAVASPQPAAPTRQLLRASAADPDSTFVPTAAALREAMPRLDIDAGIVTRVPGRANELPEGTLLKVRMNQELSTKGTAAGTRFSAALTEPVLRDGHVLLPAGSVLSGRVSDIHGGRRISGAASIHLLPQTVTLPDGSHYVIHGQVIDTDLYRSTKVNREGTIIRRDHPKETVAVLALTTGSAAAAGAVFGGAGALIGAGVGAGVSAAWWLKQDRQTSLPADTHITFALTSPLFIGTEQ